MLDCFLICATFYAFPQTYLMDHWTFNPPNHLIIAQIRLAFDVSYDLGDSLLHVIDSS